MLIASGRERHTHVCHSKRQLYVSLSIKVWVLETIHSVTKALQEWGERVPRWPSEEWCDHFHSNGSTHALQLLTAAPEFLNSHHSSTQDAHSTSPAAHYHFQCKQPLIKGAFGRTVFILKPRSFIFKTFYGLLRAGSAERGKAEEHPCTWMNIMGCPLFFRRLWTKPLREREMYFFPHKTHGFYASNFITLKPGCAFQSTTLTDVPSWLHLNIPRLPGRDYVPISRA